MGEPLVLHDATNEAIRVPGIGTMLAVGATIPANGGSGYGPGCLYVLYQTYSGDTQYYTNSGTAAAATWTALSLTEVALLNSLLSGVTAGAAAASKILVLGATKNVDTLVIGKLELGPKAVESAYASAMTIDVTQSLHTIAGVNGTSATVTLTPSAAGTDGDILVIRTTASGGTITATFASTFHPSGTQATTIGAFSTITFQSDGTRWLEICRTTALA